MTTKTTELTDENFVTFVTNTSLPVIVCFSASWCTPCKRLSIIMDAMANRYEAQAWICKIDIDNNPQVTRHFNVRSLPTVVSLRRGVEVSRAVGTIEPNQLEKMLKEVQDLIATKG